MTFSETLTIIDKKPAHVDICELLTDLSEVSGCRNCCLLKIRKNDSCQDDYKKVNPKIISRLKIEIRKQKLAKLLS